MSDFDISYNLNYGSMARGEQQVNLWARPSLLHTGLGLTQTAVRVVNYLLFSSHASCLRRSGSSVAACPPNWSVVHYEPIVDQQETSNLTYYSQFILG